MSDPLISKEISNFLSAYTDANSAIVPLSGGANNRVFKVGTSLEPLLLKCYFRHPADTRDRLASEWAFVSCAWKAGIREIPEPIACSHDLGIALYRFIAGTKFKAGELQAAEISAALSFVNKLQTIRTSDEGSLLPNSSEACFNIEAHLTLVDHRISRLKKLGESPVDRKAQIFVNDELSCGWRELRESITNRYTAKALSSEIATEDRVISPSDFGYHNAVRSDAGELYFIDFEYAGWDDPAKLVCDFFCQPAVPVPLEYYNEFRNSVAKLVNRSSEFIDRSDNLLSVYRIKWCCIMLNEFLKTDSARREFAADSSDSREERKEHQLKKAQNAYNSLKTLMTKGGPL